MKQWYCMMLMAGTAMAGGLEQRIVHETIEPGGLEVGPDGVKVSGFDWTDYTTILIITGAVILMLAAYGFVKWGPSWISAWKNRKNGNGETVRLNGKFELKDAIKHIDIKHEQIEAIINDKFNKLVKEHEGLHVARAKYESKMNSTVESMEKTFMHEIDEVQKKQEKTTDAMGKVAENLANLSGRIEGLMASRG